MQNVTDRTSNPFGMSPPRLVSADPAVVHGYGDANADIHLVGDHPRVHGGVESGVPFTGTEGARRLQRVLHEVGLLEAPDTDRPRVRNLFASYLHASVAPEGTPSDESYARLEPFFDAELRAIAAHVLLPVGDRATAHVFRKYTARTPASAAELHGQEVRGSGFLVVPIRDPAEWTDADEESLRETLEYLLTTDYRQISDLGRFLPGGDTYLVR
ncbi:MAG: uracil-DNA glycosylase family protein [Halobacteriaceae archaeon]